MRFVLLAATALFLAQPPAVAQKTDWPTATPESVGLDAKVLAAFEAEIAAGAYGYVDDLLVIRRGKLVVERHWDHDYDAIYGAEAKKPGPFNPLDPGGPYNYYNAWWHPRYRRGDLHTMQSVTKTVTSVVYGAAATRNELPSLDTPVLKFFDETKVANVDERKRRMTLRHLLTMTAGFDWNEDDYADPKNLCGQMEASADWVRFAIDRPMAHEPGKVFRYNSGASQILAHVFRAAVGQDLEEYAAKRLFAPLGIERWFWKRTPGGVADTEGGLYLRPRDLAKIAQLYLSEGDWKGTRVVSREWVKASTTPALPADEKTPLYGYKWWLAPYGPDTARLAWAGSGFGGQRPIVVPEHDLVVVATGWNIPPTTKGLGPRVLLSAVVKAVLPGK